ncbi:MAG TPA: cation:proton antiporter [Chloroflexota bacterium]|nr:cation:proton antiporter [Chloroflexota bacterium]
MPSLNEHDLLIALLALAIILVLARAMADIARRLGQPEVLGELFAGFILGPSIFGALVPDAYRTLLLNNASGLLLSGVSWIGAILLLLLAGTEVDLDILRHHLRPGGLAALFAIVPSLLAGAAFAAVALHRVPPNGIFLGIVLSVTAVSVVAKILMEKGEMRRSYAQVIMAAGVASEVVVWLFVAVVSSLHTSSPVLAGLLHAAYAVGFFVLMITVGRPVVFWAMRRVRDRTSILKGQLSLVLVLTFLAAALTQALGLHALLGAFVIGVLLSRSPRSNETLIDGIRSLTLGLFGPVFFALAGMRVDIMKLGSLSAIGLILLLFVVASAVKVACGALGARLGGQRGWEALVVGLGLNLKGGTDVVVAVVGTELGLLTARTYTIYTIVAMLTVLATPSLLRLVSSRVPPTAPEQERLDNEEAARRGYVPSLERVLVPISRELRGSRASQVVHLMADAKHAAGQIFDITELDISRRGQVLQSEPAQAARSSLDQAGSLNTVELTVEKVRAPDIVKRVVEDSENYDLVAIGAEPPARASQFSLGNRQDEIIDGADCDVLVTVSRDVGFDKTAVHHILVPTNGLDYAMAAGDVAGALAAACGATVTILHVVRPPTTESIGEGERRQLIDTAAPVLHDLEFIIGRFNVPIQREVRVGENVADEILAHLREGGCDVLVLGGVDRGKDGRLYLGQTVATVMTGIDLPTLLLVGHERSSGAASGR